MRTNRMKLLLSSLATVLAVASIAAADGLTGADPVKAPAGHDLQSHTDANTGRAAEADRPDLSAIMNSSGKLSE